MADNDLRVDYDVLDACIKELEKINSSSQDIYIAIEGLRSHFSVSNSDTANALIDALDKYEEIYRLIVRLSENSADMLGKAKFVYADVDRQNGEAISGT